MIKKLNDLYDKASVSYQQNPLNVGIVWPDSKTMFQAIETAQHKLANFTIIGDGERMKAVGESIISPDPDLTIVGTVRTPQEGANYAMGWADEFDLMMKGNLDTKIFLQAALNKDYHLTTNRMLSHVAVFEIPGYDKLLLISDAGVCIEPTLKQKVDIVQNAIDVAHRLGVPMPTVAVLSASEKVNLDMPTSTDAAILSTMQYKKQIVDANVIGPMSLDCAISPEACEAKGVYGWGNADILIVPDVTAGNMLAKSIIHFAKGRMAGVVVGAKMPLIVASRAGSVDEQVMSIALGVLMAGRETDATN